MCYLYHRETDQLIKDSPTIAPRNEFYAQISTLAAELDGVSQLAEGEGFDTVDGNFKSMADITVWVRTNIPSDAPKVDHFIDLDILLEGI